MKDRKFFVNECVICLEPITNESMCRMLSCFHIFHAHCVANWLVTNASCPMCNKDLSKVQDVKINMKEEQLQAIDVDNDCFYSDHVITRKPEFLTKKE